MGHLSCMFRASIIPSVVRSAIWTWPQNFPLFIRTDDMVPLLYGHIISEQMTRFLTITTSLPAHDLQLRWPQNGENNPPVLQCTTICHVMCLSSTNAVCL